MFLCEEGDGYSGQASRVMRMQIDAPWGKYEFEADSCLSFIAQAIDQLEFFKQKMKEPTQHILNDLEAYHQLLMSGSEKNCEVFLQMKHEAIKTGKMFKDNLEIVNAMKQSGVFWERGVSR